MSAWLSRNASPALWHSAVPQPEEGRKVAVVRTIAGTGIVYARAAARARLVAIAVVVVVEHNESLDRAEARVRLGNHIAGHREAVLHHSLRHGVGRVGRVVARARREGARSRALVVHGSDGREGIRACREVLVRAHAEEQKREESAHPCWARSSGHGGDG